MSKTIIITYEGLDGHFCSTSYSKYNERFRAYHEGKLNEPVYGLEQAKEHLKELKEHEYEGKKVNADRKLQIVEITTTRKILYHE